LNPRSFLFSLRNRERGEVRLWAGSGQRLQRWRGGVVTNAGRSWGSHGLLERIAHALAACSSTSSWVAMAGAAVLYGCACEKAERRERVSREWRGCGGE